MNETGKSTEERRPTILVLVLSIEREPYLSIERSGQQATWASPEAVPAGCSMVWYVGAEGLYRLLGRVVGRLALSRPTQRLGKSLLARLSRRSAGAGAELRGDRLYTRVPDAHKFTLPKLISALRWATAPGMPRFDYIYRTNSSSYVVLPRLQETAAALPGAACYAGFIGDYPERQCRYVSGSGMLLSWDVAVRAAGTLDGWDWNELDDVALGLFLGAGCGIDLLPLPRTDTETLADVEALSDAELREAFHFRCKSFDEPRDDAAIMRAIHARLSAGPR